MTAGAKQYPLPLPHSEAMAADDFMVTPSNSEAAAWLDKWPDWPTHCLVIYGPEGSGKTHLIHVWQSRSNGETITPHQLATLDMARFQTTPSIVAIDNADVIAGSTAQEEALFHLYNILREKKGYLLLTARQAPAQWDIRLPDLRSRLLSIPAITLGAMDDALISALLIKQFRDRQIDIGMDVVDFLLPRMTRTPAMLRELVQKLDRASLAEGRGITVALARRVLEDQSFPNP